MVILRVVTKSGSVYLLRDGEVLIEKAHTNKPLGEWFPIADFNIGNRLLIIYKDMKTRRTSEVQSVTAYSCPLSS